MDDWIEIGLTEAAASLVQNSTATSTDLKSSRALSSFQWGGTISAILLLILNHFGRRSPMQTTLLVMCMVISFPTTLFKILRGQFGCWVAFLAIGANLFFPQTFPASRFILFVITPDWLADELRDSIVGGVFCLIFVIFLLLIEIREIGGIRNCECNMHCFGFCLGMAFLMFFTTLYLCLGTW